MRLFVSSVVAGTITLVENNNKTTFAQGIDRPFGMVHNPTDNCFCVARYGGGLSRVSPDGVVSDVPLSEQLDGPNGLTVDTEGNLYAACYDKGDTGMGRIARISPSGEVSTLVDGLTGPGGILYHDGALYVTCFASPKNGALLWKVGLDGSLTTLINNKNSCPWDLCQAGGKLFIVGNMNGQILSYDTARQTQTSLLTSFSLRGGMGIDTDGTSLFIANMNSGILYRLPVAGGTLVQVVTGLNYPTDVVCLP